MPYRSRLKPWTIAAGVVAAVLFVIALSNDVYTLTSPPSLSWHVLLRKAYSIVAFAAVGFSADKALGSYERARVRGAVLVALYSATIEIAQARTHEGLLWNTVDVACGAAGGWLGVSAGRIIRSRRDGRRKRRRR